MLNKNDIKQMAKMKTEYIAHALSLADKIGETLAKFDGKSITGNKKRISDAVEQLDPSLRVYIEPDSWGWVWLRVKYYAKTRNFQTSGGNWQYIDGSDSILWELVKDNTINAAELTARIENYKTQTAKELERIKTTARDIEKIAARAEKLKKELSELSLNSDHELTDAFGISFKKN